MFTGFGRGWTRFCRQKISRTFIVVLQGFFWHRELISARQVTEDPQVFGWLELLGPLPPTGEDSWIPSRDQLQLPPWRRAGSKTPVRCGAGSRLHSGAASLGADQSKDDSHRDMRAIALQHAAATRVSVFLCQRKAFPEI